jgi:hypothetical protein
MRYVCTGCHALRLLDVFKAEIGKLVPIIVKSLPNPSKASKLLASCETKGIDSLNSLLVSGVELVLGSEEESYGRRLCRGFSQ